MTSKPQKNKPINKKCIGKVTIKCEPKVVNNKCFVSMNVKNRSKYISITFSNI